MIKSKHSLQKLALLMMISWCFSCQKHTIPIETSTDNNPEIVFLIMDITGKLQTKSSLTIREKKVVEGVLKSSSEIQQEYKNFIGVEHIYNDKKEVHIIEHPLYKNVEFTTENGMGRKDIVTEKGEFFIRLQRFTPHDKVSIFEQVNNEKRSLLKTTL